MISKKKSVKINLTTRSDGKVDVVKWHNNEVKRRINGQQKRDYRLLLADPKREPYN
ncbi:hypothetical protein T4B_8588 [Trichinella pseudospiralis]|uniref:Uncharacterized protein n=1 Tax=Trichinella pseudospiralis TaxID=6337 RepID=A0A0V1GYX3_TRIPS|nr:hypothetical protein T4A_13355 [Trichinella pseudospiralis]KRZ03235.1 hypothetical protein T4B_8588 [Trichinella pseudospiralis]